MGTTQFRRSTAQSLDALTGQSGRTFRGFSLYLVLVYSVLFGLGFDSKLGAEEWASEDAMESELVNSMLSDFADYVAERDQPIKKDSLSQVGAGDPRPGTDIDDLFRNDPVDRPALPSTGGIFDPGAGYGGGFGSGGFSTISARQGAPYLLAMESLYQTLNFYGVKHYLEKTPTSVDFRIVESKSGYFTKLNRLDVAFALREFSRYFTAHLCNDASIDNFYKALSQVPAEEIGMRFKYDMAWALLGNFLPRQPNSTYIIGTKWAALGKIINSSKTFSANTNEGKELQKWTGLISDMMNLLQGLNTMMCFVDIRTKPKDEIRKRIVIKKILEMEKNLNAIYAPMKQMIEDAKKMGAAEQLSYIRQE